MKWMMMVLLGVNFLTMVLHSPAHGQADQRPAIQSDVLRFNELGKVFANDAHFDRALSFFTRALNRVEEDGRWIILNNSANVYVLLEEYDTAETLYLEALADSAATGKVHLNLGLLYQARGEMDECFRQFSLGAKSLGGVEEVRTLMGLRGGAAPLDGPRADAPGRFTTAQLEAVLRVIERQEEGQEGEEVQSNGELRGFRGAHLKPYRLFWLDLTD